MEEILASDTPTHPCRRRTRRESICWLPPARRGRNPRPDRSDRRRRFGAAHRAGQASAARYATMPPVLPDGRAEPAPPRPESARLQRAPRCPSPGFERCLRVFCPPRGDAAPRANRRGTRQRAGARRFRARDPAAPLAGAGLDEHLPTLVEQPGAGGDRPRHGRCRQALNGRTSRNARQDLSSGRGRAAAIRGLGAFGRVRGASRQRQASLYDHDAAAQRDRQPAYGSRADVYAARHPHPLRADARAGRTVATGHRPCRDRD